VTDTSRSKGMWFQLAHSLFVRFCGETLQTIITSLWSLSIMSAIMESCYYNDAAIDRALAWFCSTCLLRGRLQGYIGANMSESDRW